MLQKQKHGEWRWFDGAITCPDANGAVYVHARGRFIHIAGKRMRCSPDPDLLAPDLRDPGTLYASLSVVREVEDATEAAFVHTPAEPGIVSIVIKKVFGYETVSKGASRSEAVARYFRITDPPGSALQAAGEAP